MTEEKPKVAFFDFAGCEGDQLQIVNLEEKLLDLLDLVEIVSFREVTKAHSDDYKIAFIEGSIQRPIDDERLKEVRSNADVLVALGDCASNGCVNKLQKDWSVEESQEDVYGDAKEQIEDNELFNVDSPRAVDEVVDVDYYLRGCPVRGERVFHFIRRVVEKPFDTNKDISFPLSLRNREPDERSLVNYNSNKCILCRRCVNVCQDVLGVDALGPVDKGWETIISTPEDVGFDANGCIQCGQCVSVCPVDALYADSPVEELSQDLEEKDLTIALDSVALSSFVLRHSVLQDMDPVKAEKYVIAALRKVGFDKVVQYDHYISESQEMDSEEDAPVLASWCLPARNYIEDERIGELEIKEDNSPWNLLLEDVEGDVCLLSSCTGHKDLDDYEHVLSAEDLEDLFKEKDLDIGFVEFEDECYDSEVVNSDFEHPGVSFDEDHFKVTEDLEDELSDSSLEDGPVDVFPCLQGCVSGGGNYPTTDDSEVQSRIDWIKDLREVGY